VSDPIIPFMVGFVIGAAVTATLVFLLFERETRW